jgi:ParB family chromosome partitioning protein
LASLIPTEATGDRSSTLREVPISSIRPNPRQPRANFGEEALAALAASIKELGVLQPVLVRPLGDGDDVEEFELIAGERRWRASKRANLQMIPVLVQATSDTLSLEQALVENLHRQDLNALEEASAYQQLIEDFGYTHDQVAKRVGKSRAAVTNTLRLLQLPAGAQRLVAEGRISAGHARALLGTPDRGYQDHLAGVIASEGLSVRAVEDLVRQQTGAGADEGMGERAPVRSLEQAPVNAEQPSPNGTAVPGGGGVGPAAAPRSSLPPPGILELEQLLSDRLDTRVKVEMTAKRGRLVIDFATLEDLERIYKVMVGASQPGRSAS